MRDFIASQNSERLRQRLSRGLKVREPAAFAKLAQSTMDMALVTGIVARLYRAVILTRSGEDSGAYLVLLSIGAVFLLGMATLYLSRFPLREWLWRAPAFAALAGGFEMLTSLALIAANREPLGTVAARYADWPEMAVKAIAWRVATLCVFALLLGGIVRWVRYTLLRRDHTAWAAGTVKAGIPGEDFIDRRRAASAKIAFPAAATADRRRKQ